MDNEQVSRMDKRVYALEKRGASIDEGMDAVDTHVYAMQGHALDELKQQAHAVEYYVLFVNCSGSKQERIWMCRASEDERVVAEEERAAAADERLAAEDERVAAEDEGKDAEQWMNDV